MNSDKFVYYDADFLAKFKKLAEVMEEKDKAVLHRYLIDNFSHIFRVFQYYAREDGSGGVKEFEEVDAAMKRELMRPLSFRQYRMIQRSETWIAEEEDLLISSIWDFLYDNGRIYEKKIMSCAEVAGASLILENVYTALAK